MKTHQTKRIYRVRCRSGLFGWRTRLRNNYAHMIEFRDHDRIYDLVHRLGYDSVLAAWNANPVIEGSTNPSDYRKVAE